MEIQFGPNSEDEPKLLYKLQRKLKVFKEHSLPNRGYNLITCSSKYALVFIASPEGILSVYHLRDLINKECESPLHLSIKIPENPTHISVNCDFEYLAVTGGQLLNIYNIANFQNQNFQPSISIRCDVNPATFVSSLQWNPCIPDTIALAFFDGTLLISQVNTVQVKKIQSNARCVCWSPKGKQLVVGNNDGTLCQYKPDLTPAKTVLAPDLFKGASVETLAVHWISTYQFVVVYRNSSGEGQPVVAIINTPKTGRPLCLNYEDICYSSGCSRPWNLILVSSSNSMEIATLGSMDGNNWTHWCQIDEARAELPLLGKQESYPVGLCFDYSAIHQLPWGENETLPHMPLLHIVSHSGLLAIFNVINLKTNDQICVPPQEIILPAESLIKEDSSDVVQSKQQQSPAPKPDVLEPLDSQESKQITANISSSQSQTTVQGNGTVKNPNFDMPIVETSATIKIPSFSKGQQASTGPAFGSKPEIKEEIKNEISKHNLNPLNIQISTQMPASKAQVSKNTSREFKPNDLKQEKIAAETLDHELKTMVMKEVNDFQMEHYNFMQKLKASNAQVSQDLKLIEANPNFQSMNEEKLKQECYLEELRAAIVQLKRELVRSCAVVAEAQSHAGNSLGSYKMAAWQMSDVKSSIPGAFFELNAFKAVLNSAPVKGRSTSVKIFKASGGRSLPLYDSKSWVWLMKNETRINAVAMRSLRSICGGSRKDICRISDVRGRYGLKEDVVTKVEKDMLRAEDLYRWNQVDPLSNKRIESIKKLIYYMQSQLDQAHQALNYKWKEVLHDPNSKKSVPYMIRPVLEDVYQPLVKQQEILSRQEAVLKTLHDTLNECDLSPMWKSKSLLRSTPFRNKDPLSKLAKNILNMSIESKTKLNEPRLSSQKLDTLKDMLANYKTVKIKPVNVELHQHLNAMKINFEDYIKEKFTLEKKDLAEVGYDVKKTIPQHATVPNVTGESYKESLKTETASVYEICPEIGNNAEDIVPRSTIDPCKEIEKDAMPIQVFPKVTSTFNTIAPIKSATSTIIPQSSILKDLLKNNDSNTFMGQKICSPIPTTAANTNETSISALFSSNQSLSGMYSQNSKFSIGQLPLSIMQPNAKSAETGESEDLPKDTSVVQSLPFPVQVSNENKNPSLISAFSIKPDLKTNKPVFNKSGIQPLESSQLSTQNVPDILNTNSVKSLSESKKNAVDTKPLTNMSELKFNVQIKAENESGKSMSVQIINRNIDLKPIVTEPEKKQSLKIQPEKVNTVTVTKADTKINVPESSQISTSIEVYESMNTPSTKTSTRVSSDILEVKLESPKMSTEITSNKSVASTLFASANASVPKSPPTLGVNATTRGSIFGSGTATQASNIFATANAKVPPSTFGASTITSTLSLTTTPSLTTSVFGASVTSSQALPNTRSPSSPAVQSKQLDACNAISSPQTCNTPTTIQSPLFGVTAPSSPASPSVFTGTVSPSAFDVQTSIIQSIALGEPDAMSPQKCMSATPCTSATPVFSGAVSTSSSIFGNSAQVTQTSPFDTSNATTTVSIFGGTTTQASIFGTPSSTTTKSIFGISTATTTNGKSIFRPSPTTAQSSIFGSPTPTTTQSSIFGTSNPTTTSETSLFGMSESNLFAAVSISTTSAPSQSTTGNIFGTGSNTSNVFGGATGNVFGNKAAFGQSNNPASIFGSQSAFGQQQQQQTSLWGGGNTGSAFGSAFSQPNQTPSVFGGDGALSPGTGQAFGGPAPVGSQSPVFGSPQQSSSSFGGSPVFGGQSAFGQGATFGGSPGGGAGAFGSFGGFNKSPSGGFGAPATFGGGNTFGSSSPGKPFGGVSPGFGATTQSNATFESLATQNTLTFGNLAQQSAQQSTPAFSK
ncbi:Nuclear pore complex protein Nup214 [Eumeta japonica]|uniref:Nuclear pore complex protein Nup214 n=1 Tax=Eumeta variegata TaxID=151549 RepID=A0A4C1U4K4_EUMVA|nr:Nuclear pore complex protein Nup214 [Eumeta japonica]